MLRLAFAQYGAKVALCDLKVDRGEEVAQDTRCELTERTISVTWCAPTEALRQVGATAGQRTQAGVVGFRHLHAEALVHADDELQEREGIDVQRLSEVRGRVELVEVGFRRKLA